MILIAITHDKSCPGMKRNAISVQRHSQNILRVDLVKKCYFEVHRDSSC